MGTNRLVHLLDQWSIGGGPLYRALGDRILHLIAEGSLRAGERLPPERGLAAALGVSRGTVVRSYDALAEVGAVRRVQGSGTTIEGTRWSGVADRDGFVGEELWESQRASIDLLKAVPRMLPSVGELVTSIDLTDHVDDLDEAEPLGWWRLRERIADLHTRQELPTSPHQILVTSGAQQAISLTISAMVKPGDVVLGEECTWPGLVDSVLQVGARFEPVLLDGNGIVIDDLAAKLARYRPSLIALNPQHQNPTGTRLPEHRVAAIAELVRRHRIPVIEDRVTADLGFDRRLRPAIDQFDTGGYGLTAGSICKVAWPGLRVGWIRGDAQVVNQLRSHKAVADMHTPALSQLLGIAIVDRYEEFVEERLEQTRALADIALDALRADLDGWTSTPLRGGLCLWATLPDNASATAFAQHAARHGVSVASGRSFDARDIDGPNVRIPFTASASVLSEGMRRLATAWRTFDGAPVGSDVI
ncbi:MAG: PLP-dependent aminotransferase family protein [Actinomycetota bacterium]